jgi:drug/metabolite transporter (DMT)-like permease
MQSGSLRGIGAMLIAAAVFAVMDATLKQLSPHYPPLQVASMRGWASLPFLLLPVICSGRWRELRPVRWYLHVLRGLLAVAMLCLFVFSLRSLSLADAYSITLCAPLLITALSVPLLREHVDGRRWLAIAVGLCGVLVILRPSAGSAITFGALAAVGATICYALASILIRMAARSESTLSMSLSFVAVVAVAAGVLAAPNWIAVREVDWPVLALLGLTGALGQYFVIEAFRQAPASVVAPFDYTALLWGALIDWLIWSTVPGSQTYLGGGIVVASGLYLIYRERYREHPSQAA